MELIKLEKIDNTSITLDDLFSIAYECIKHDIPKNTPVLISQHKDELASNAVQILADEESINIYDWI